MPLAPDPTTVVRHLRDIDACLERGDVAEACRLAEAAKVRGAAHPRLHRVLAHGHEAQGRHDEALAELGQGLELDPSNLDLVVAVGFCLIQLDRRPEALGVFRHAVALAPGSVAARFGLAIALKATFALAEAKAAFEQTLALDPAHARAAAELAGICLSQERPEEARALVERALAQDPADAEANIVLGKLALTDGDHVTAHDKAREGLEIAGLGLGKRAELRFLLADALDGLGRADEAFAAYVAAKSDERARYTDAFERPGQESAWQGAERALETFLATPVERWAPPPATAAASHADPVFLFGFPRSGTTLLENVLASHPGVVCLEEQPTLADPSALFLNAAGGLERLSQIPSQDLGMFRSLYWRRVREFGAADPTGKVFVDKQPLGVFMLPVIAKIFPGARILFPLRDPRDVVLSCFRRDFQMTASMFEFTTLERTARYYDVAMRSMAAFSERLPLAVHEVRYERLVEDFDAEVEAACAFLGLAWSDALRDFPHTARARGVRSRSWNQVTRPLNRNGVAQWRRYERALEPVLPILAPWIERFGYDRSGAR